MGAVGNVVAFVVVVAFVGCAKPGGASNAGADSSNVKTSLGSEICSYFSVSLLGSSFSFDETAIPSSVPKTI